MSRRFHILQGIFHSKIHFSKILMISDDLCAAKFLVLHCWTRIRAAEWKVRMECPYFEKVTFISKMKMIPLSLEDGGTYEQVAGGVEGFPGIAGICGHGIKPGHF
jgi:hypothetical protein